MGSGIVSRKSIVDDIFPSGVPRLWCPLLTHYTDDLELDKQRISAQLRSIRPWVSSFLAPGSTGDGWEMTSGEADTLIDFLLEEAGRQDFYVMIGVLRTGKGEALQAIQSSLARLTAGDPSTATLAAKRICGFTVTAPKGGDLTQETILRELDAIARTAVPLAIYQLPQITDNEMAPGTVASLVSRYPNLYLLKDTSGHDRVAMSGVDLSDLFMMRGAEGDYSRWFKRNGGKYDGFLLSTANCLAKELSAIMDLLLEGEVEAAEALSRRISALVQGVLAEVAELPFGNPFSNGNKAMDHIMAWGADYASVPLPMTHAGKRLPSSLVDSVANLFDRYGFDTTKGYMEW